MLRRRCLGRPVVLLDAHGDVRPLGLGGASYEAVGQQRGALNVGDERHAEVYGGASDEVTGADLLRLLRPLFRFGLQELHQELQTGVREREVPTDQPNADRRLPGSGRERRCLPVLLGDSRSRQKTQERGSNTQNVKRETKTACVRRNWRT